MKLKEIFSESSMPGLANLIQNWGGKIPKSFSKEELIDQLSMLIQDPFRLQKVVISLIPDERNFLGAVLICDGNVDLDKFSRLTGKNELKYSYSFYASNIQSRGLLLIKYNRNTTDIIIPDELKALLKKLIIEYRPVDHVDEDIKLEQIDASPIIDTIFRICIFAQNRGGIRLTQPGHIFKKVKEQLFEILGKCSEDQLEYAINLMIKCRILDRDEKSNSLHLFDENSIRDIFSKSKEKATAEMIVPIIAMHHLNKELVTKFLDFLNQKRDNDWIDYWDFIKTQRRDFFEKKDVKGWLEFNIYDLNQLISGLYFLGILDIKYFKYYNHANIHSFKISAFSRHVFELSDIKKKKDVVNKTDRPFIVSPNFEVTVFAEETDYYTIYRLSKIAQVLKFDTVYTFRLEKELVLRELTQGSELAQIISFLVQHSKKELPQNVQYSLSDWGSKYGKVIAGKGYIEIIDRSLYERIEQIISPYIIRSINNPVILFDEKNTDEITSRLRKADIFPSTWKKVAAEKNIDVD